MKLQALVIDGTTGGIFRKPSPYERETEVILAHRQLNQKVISILALQNSLLKKVSLVKSGLLELVDRKITVSQGRGNARVDTRHDRKIEMR